MTVNQFQVDPSSGHPADVAMARENSPQPVGSALTAQELASLAQFSPADLVSHLANADAEVPINSPLRKMSSAELRTAMDQGLRAISDLRNSQQAIGRLESRAQSSNDVARLIGIPAYDSRGQAILDMTGSEYERASEAAEQSRKSAAMAGLRDLEYNSALQQLADSAPDARPQPAADTNQPPSAQSDEAKLNDMGNGNFELLMPTGERFLGPTEKIQQEVIKSYVSGKRWTQSIKAENKQLRAQLAALQNGQQPGATVPETPQPTSAATGNDLGQLPDESTMWLLSNVAKVAGFPDANAYLSYQQQRDQRLQELESKFETFDQRMIAEDFLVAHPEFPNTTEAANILDNLMTRSGLAPSAENLGLLHTYAVQSNMYRPLPPETELTSTSTGRRVPPTPPQGSAPGGNDDVNPWTMGRDDLRRRVLEGGGMAKALMDLKAGETFGT